MEVNKFFAKHGFRLIYVPAQGHLVRGFELLGEANFHQQITPLFITEKLRERPELQRSITVSEAIALLDVVLEDERAVRNLPGLRLMPLASGVVEEWPQRPGHETSSIAVAEGSIYNIIKKARPEILITEKCGELVSMRLMGFASILGIKILQNPIFSGSSQDRTTPH